MSIGMEETFDLLNPPLETVSDFPSKMRWFAQLSLAKRDADDRLDAIKAKIAELEPHLLEEMAMNGIDRQTVLGLTIFPRTDLVVNKKSDKDGVTTEDVCQAMREAGLGYMISEGYSSASLKSKIKEYREQGVEIPEGLLSKLVVFEKLTLTTRK